jgi:hypothetical protein
VSSGITLLVHLRTKSQYGAEKRARIEERREELRQRLVPWDYSAEQFEQELGDPRSALARIIRYEESKWPFWRYNDVVGYVEVWYSGYEIRADLFLARGRISRRLKRKEFASCEKAASHYWPAGEQRPNARSLRKSVKIVIDYVRALLDSHRPRLYLDCDDRLIDSVDFMTLFHLRRQQSPPDAP